MSHSSVRVRTTIVAVAVVGTALVLSAAAIVLVLKGSAESNIEETARLRAADFVALLESGTAPSDLSIRLEEDVFVQIVDERGAVRAASPTVDGKPPVARLAEDETATVPDPQDGDDPFLVVSATADYASGPLRVLVGRDISDVWETTRLVIVALGVAIPLLLIIVALATWSTVGMALGPVESMRREVAEISGKELHRRVPEPPGDDEIVRLARTMNDMLARLESAQAKQQRLVSDASHEFRNPLAAIRQYVEVALTHPEETTVPELAREVLPESLRLQRIAEDLLLLARADENALPLRLAPMDLAEVVRDEVTTLEKAGSLTVEADLHEAIVNGDRDHLQRLVRNLSENAARHAAGTIRFEIVPNGRRIHLLIEDDGPGVPEEARTSIFERFARADESRARDEGGAGLGLAIVAEIAAAHGGTATVTTASLGGARFVVDLPSA